ncbi:hypothetical protein Tco_0722615 [Tanacetum coccineum]
MHKLDIYSVTRVLFILPRYGTNALSKFSPDTELVLFPLQDKSLDLSALKLSCLFFSLVSLGLHSLSTASLNARVFSYRLRLSILKISTWYTLIYQQVIISGNEVEFNITFHDVPNEVISYVNMLGSLVNYSVVGDGYCTGAVKKDGYHLIFYVTVCSSYIFSFS